MCIYIYIYMYVCIYTFICIHHFIYIYAYTHTLTYTHDVQAYLTHILQALECSYMITYTYIYIHIYIQLYTYSCIYECRHDWRIFCRHWSVHLRMWMYSCIYVHYAHTDAHAYAGILGAHIAGVGVRRHSCRAYRAATRRQLLDMRELIRFFHELVWVRHIVRDSLVRNKCYSWRAHSLSQRQLPKH